MLLSPFVLSLGAPPLRFSGNLLINFLLSESSS